MTMKYKCSYSVKFDSNSTTRYNSSEVRSYKIMKVQEHMNEYTYEEAAQELGVSVYTIRTATSRGNILTVRRKGSKNKYISAEEIERVRGKSLLSRRKPVAPAPAPAPAPIAGATEAMTTERLGMVTQVIMAIFNGLTIEAGKVSSLLINAILAPNQFPESTKELSNLMSVLSTKQGISPTDIGEFIQRLDTATSKDLHSEQAIPDEFKVRGAAFLAEEAQRQRVLLPA